MRGPVLDRDNGKATRAEDRLTKLRRDMVEYHLRRRGVKDERVLQAFLKIPRHKFVQPQDLWQAYEDYPLPIGFGQTISQPYMVAIMTELLELKGNERVLEIGTGSGYQAAILAELAHEVVTIERIPELARRAEQILRELGYTNVKVVIGDGSKGYLNDAPYDGIVVTAAAPNVPEVLLQQLKDGGRLVIPVGTQSLQELVRVIRQGDHFKRQNFGSCMFVPLIGEAGWHNEQEQNLEEGW